MERRRSTRPPVKQEGIVDELRCRILDRSFAPGSRLPTRHELQRRFMVSSVTVQRALDRLADDGFIEARGRHGTFVTAHPPHSCHYGLVFPVAPGDVGWVRFWTALGNEGIALQRDLTRTVSLYHGIDGHSDTDDHQRLLRDIRGQRLAGLVFASHPFRLIESPVLLQPGLPRLAFVDPGEVQGVTALQLEAASFIDRALDHFRARGRRRVALLAVPGHGGDFHRRFLAGLAARGMETRPYWTQTVSPGSADAACRLAHLLLQPNQAELPDALLISDDNLVEHATAGLIAAGAGVPEVCEVVAHCNFPWPTPSVLPVRRLGYDARQALRLAMAEIDRQRRGEPPSASIPIPALFEDEVEGAVDRAVHRPPYGPGMALRG
jgi:DNA-binding LacI/PurR family transcriptional regulator